MKKKLLSLALACAMILTLAIPAFATDYYSHGETASEDLTQTVTISAKTFVPTVKLTLPGLTDPSIVLNPYKIAYTGGPDTNPTKLNGEDVGDTDDQIKQVISPIYTIKNETDVKLNFAVAVTGSVEGEVTFSNDPVAVKETNKKAHVGLVMMKKELSAAPSADTSSAQTLIGATVGSATITKSDVEIVYLKTSETKLTAQKSLADAKTAANYLAFQFIGDLTRKPTKAWADTDKVSAVITFTFTPESRQDYTVDATSGTAISVSKAATTTSQDIVTVDNVKADSAMANATYAANAKWEVADGGAYAAKADNSTMTKAVFDTNALKAIRALAQGDYTQSIVLAVPDEDNIPRTIEYKFKLTVTS